LTLAANPAGTDLDGQRGRRHGPLVAITPGFVAGEPAVVARHLLGTLLVRDDRRGRRVARIVETEAYAGPEDMASHARAGRTARNAVMFGPPGRAYVYLVYGMHHCLNVVCASDGEAGAVLIRAVAPVAGIEAMRADRGRPTDAVARLAAGPARTCQALDIDRRHDGLDLLNDPSLWLASDGGDPIPAPSMLVGPRIGVDYAGPEWAGRRWRYGVSGSASLSRPFPAGS
jgi:DNA-3-methyladenine glycosylase